MLNQSSISRLMGQRFAETLGPQRAHPVVSAMQFQAQTLGSEPGDGGATMRVGDHQMLPKGARAWIVGGQPDNQGRQIPTTYAQPHEVTLPRILNETQRVRDATRGARDSHKASVGSWVNPDDGRVNFDASFATDSRREAKRLGKRRGEWAVWDNARGKALKTRFE